MRILKRDCERNYLTSFSSSSNCRQVKVRKMDTVLKVKQTLCETFVSFIRLERLFF